jgi:hypothetical protein
MSQKNQYWNGWCFKTVMGCNREMQKNLALEIDQNLPEAGHISTKQILQMACKLPGFNQVLVFSFLYQILLKFHCCPEHHVLE